tara:strand:+ start:2260 stop:2949 length:690 start_codon:yes stop_codon:yes gene_type:complete
MKQFLIISASRSNTDTEVSLARSLEDMKKYNVTTQDHQVILQLDNKEGLSKIYNQYLNTKYLNKYEGIIFVHDDVYIDDIKFLEKIKNQFRKGFSVVGLAGASAAKIGKPALWHLMSDRKDYAGAVDHPHSENVSYTTAFGPTPKRCLIMDGLFLAINCKKFKKTPVKFDEQFNFHHYDLDFCLQCNSKGHKLTTTNINVLHSSPGLLNINSPSYQKSEELFLNKYVKN